MTTNLELTIDDGLRLAEVRSLCRRGFARKVRVDAHLSMSDVARIVGVHRVSILNWELGKREPQGQPALRYAELLRRLRDGA